jgi:hypothetical protein
MKIYHLATLVLASFCVTFVDGNERDSSHHYKILRQCDRKRFAESPKLLPKSPNVEPNLENIFLLRVIKF